MESLATVKDLFAHMEWADATVWRAVMANEAARTDARLLNLLMHFNVTQHAFLYAWQGTPLDFAAISAFDIDALAKWARDYHGELARFLGTVTPSTLDQAMSVPWAARVAERLGRDSVGTPTVRETMSQVVMHTTYHRGQVNARLRELGAEPPMVDYIAWIWFERPAPEWPPLPAP